MKEDNNRKRTSSQSDRERRQIAIVSKLTADPTRPTGFDSDGSKQPMQPPTALLNKVSQRTASVLNDTESINQLLPDIELTTQILISSVLSPKDLGQPKIMLSSDADIGDEEVKSALLKIIEEYFVDDYSINDSLPKILREALVSKGAYVEAIIPESVIDKLVNPEGRITLESFSTPEFRGAVSNDFTVSPIGLIDPVTVTSSVKKDDKREVSLESMLDTTNDSTARREDYKLCDYLYLNDNPDSLKIPSVVSTIDRLKRQKRLSTRYTMESFVDLELLRLEALEEEYTQESNDPEKDVKVRDVKEQRRQVDELKGLTHQEIMERLRSSQYYKASANGFIEIEESMMSGNVGHPMVLKLPMESVVPIFMPGKPEEHLGYFVLLDQFGNAIDLTNMTDQYRQLQNNLADTSGKTAVSNILNELRTANVGGNEDTATTVTEAVTAFGDMMERKLLRSISGGIQNTSVKLGYTSDIYAMMLARSLAKQNTQVIYIPSEMISYISFNHTTHGVGKSLLEDTRILGSLRVLTMFSNTMSAIRNSSSRTELNISFDPTDTDPLGTAAVVKDAFMRTRAEGYPLGEGDPSVMIRYLQEANVDLVYGNHPDLPEMSVTTNEKAVSRTAVDRDLEENLREWHIMGFGLSPETVDTGKNVDFATSIVASNLLLSKRVIILQQKFESDLEHKIKTQTRFSETLITRMLTAIREKGNRNSKKNAREVIENFIKKLRVSLPKPDVATLEAKMESLKSYTDALDIALEHIISEDFALTDVEGELTSNLREVRAAVKAHYVRRYMKENNILPELEEITELDDKGKSVLKFDDIQSKHMKAVLGSIESYIKKAMRASKKRDAAMAKFEEELDNTEEDDDTTDTDNTDTDNTDGGDDGVDETGGDEGGEESEVDGGDDLDAGDEPADDGDAGEDDALPEV